MRPNPISALHAAAEARRARRWRDQLDDAVLASAAAAAAIELGPRARAVPFRALPVYRQTCAATGLRPATSTVLPDLPQIQAHLDVLAAPLRREPIVAPALLANAHAEHDRRTAVAR